ncbi:MAG: isocitrate/isopropylmalate dehydrogenase family protein [Chloroflexota bacterium]|nr:isocitrate/isopropylmalate dehydrogenase family protein [Chloroflexota bacterium]
MSYVVTLIPGDGIGPELADATRRVLDATGVALTWDVQQAGADQIEATGTPLPEAVLDSIRRNKVAIKGPITTPVGGGFRSVNVGLRKALNLYACLRPCKTYQGVQSRYEHVDVVVVRENTEDLYSGIEFDDGSDGAREMIRVIEQIEGSRIPASSALAIKFISPEASERIVRFAFAYARENGRKKVSAVHKANIMKYADGLFLEVARSVAAEYPEIEFNDVIVDNMMMQLVQKPELYDVLVCPNLYGDIVSDLCAGLVGGLGIAPGANYGEDTALFEPIHGSAPKYTGQNKANPMAMMFSGVLMLRHLGELDAAIRLDRALSETIAEGRNVTYDLLPTSERGRALGTSEVADALIEKLRA